ncbi:putative alpha subunit [Lyophyllum shimeji]|uniref:Alpha subunit n=1 Tax=Lyophyllum shimeji TaxID=47721 RepID=A0A9P3PZT5_LYOSH|nr:putative alpha subunit [Lyophyllum shimeji]
MRSSPGREATISPDLIPMDFAKPEHITAGEYFDEQAVKISNLIDEELRKEAARRRDASRKEVKVMLLGQAESGKSTLQKQFQLYYASQTLDHERPSWRPVVYFNILKAVRMTLDELDYEFSVRSKEDPNSITEVPVASSSSQTLYEDEAASANEGVWQREIGELRLKLLPLVAIEDTLASELSGGISVSGGRTGAYVRSGWQALVTSNWPLSDSRPRAKSHAPEVIQLAAKTLASTAESIKALWKHRAVRRLTESRKLRLDESAPFFLNNIDRIVEPDFLPSNDDILNVRLQTLGVMEHTFPINMGGATYDWKLYDVGGARGQRHAWVPYFDDATAIIFLAPMSAFDQYLEEDPKTNRIDDSLQLFNAICSNKLLVRAHLVLLLNKADLLKKKLASGIKVQKYITSYGERPNVYENVAEYFRSHFVQVHKRKDIAKRSLYVHFSSMLDIKATQSIIANVGEVILRQHIEKIGLA